MSTWLKLLPLELKEVKHLTEPVEEVKEGETVVGTISEDLKKLYTFFKTLEKEANLMEVELKYIKATPEQFGKLAEKKNKAGILRGIFTIGIYDELGLWSHPEPADIRSGWRVVEYKHQSFPGFLGNLFKPQGG